MKVLVTGGNGFIGGYTVARLRAVGFQPIIFDRHRQPLQGALAQQILGDIRDATAVNEAMAHVDAWIHLAGVLGTQETITNPLPAAETNVLGGLNVLEAASQYQLPGVNIAVGNYWMNNTYSITKNAVERFCAMYRVERNLPVTVVRAYNAYGPGQSVAAPYGASKVRKIMPSFICRALVGEPVEIYGDGEQVMDMIYVSDVAQILVNSLRETIEHGGKSHIVQAGSGRSTTVNQIAQEVVKAVAFRTEEPAAEIVYLPMRPGEPEGETVLADNPALGDYIMHLPQGIRKTVDWFHDTWLPKWRSQN